ncbi:MAG: hypothetical protein ACM3P0_15760 [Acidobacteriota bacterium]
MGALPEFKRQAWAFLSNEAKHYAQEYLEAGDKIVINYSSLQFKYQVNKFEQQRYFI